MTLLVDIILLIALLSIISSCYQAGLIKTFGGLVGMVVGIVVAGQYFETFAGWLEPVFKSAENLNKIVSFAVIFIVVNAIIALVIFLLDSTFNFISFIPFLKTINKMGGAVLGFLAGLLILGIAIVLLDKFPFASYVQPYLESSRLVPIFARIANLIMPLFPEVIRKVQGAL
ncbi:MAG: CvpA family protein [Candidatus Kuenenbacteria bacterium]